MTAPFRDAVYANFKDIFWVQQERREKGLSRKSRIDCEERVLKIIAAIKEYENPLIVTWRKYQNVNCWRRLKLLNTYNYLYQDINMPQQLLLISWLR